MLLSIVIINYNTFRLTCDCIRSVKRTAHVPHEIVLVDNNSKECVPEKFLEAFPDVKLISLKENVGFGRANNRGVEGATGKYVLLLNSDTVVNEGTLDETVNYLEKNPEVDVLGCKVLYHDQTVQTTVVRDQREYNLAAALKFLVKRNAFFVETRLRRQNRRAKNTGPASGAEEAPAPVTGRSAIEANYHDGKRIGSLVGVFLLLKRNVYLASKGFDPDFFMYYEEIEWFVNRLRNYNIVYYPHASIIHYQSGSDVHKKMHLQFWVSQHLFWYKMGYPQYFFYFFFNLLDIAGRWLVKVLYKRTLPSEDVPAMLKALGCFVHVLRYPNRYGSRPEGLKLAYLRKRDL